MPDACVGAGRRAAAGGWPAGVSEGGRVRRDLASGSAGPCPPRSRPPRERYFFAAGAAIVSCLTILLSPHFSGFSLATWSTK